MKDHTVSIFHLFQSYCLLQLRQRKLQNINPDVIISLHQLNSHTAVPGYFSKSFPWISMLHLVQRVFL